MKKILKSIFSRFTITSLIIIAEFAFFIYLLVDLYNITWIVLIIGMIINILVLLKIVNMDMNPDYKLPWISIVLLTSPFGGIIFLMFHNNHLSKKDYKKYQVIAGCLKKQINQSSVLNKMQELNEIDPVSYHQAVYVTYSSLMPIEKNTQVTYFSSGEELFPSLIQDLENAKSFIFLEYFIIEPGVMWNSILEILKQKARDGVDCRVIYDDMGSIKTLPRKYDSYLRSLGIKSYAFNEFKPVLSAVHNNRDHRKIAVIDGVVSYNGGINLADEYINKKVRFGYWKDAGLRLVGDGTKNFTALFLSVWDFLSGKISSYDKYIKIKHSIVDNSFVLPFGDGPKPLYDEEIGKTVYLNLINQATKYIYITSPYFIVDHELMNALKIAAKRGVEVCIITPHIPDKKIPFLLTRSSYLPLLKAGCHIYEFTPGFIHAKNVIVDDICYVCGTINFDYRSLVHHFECGTIVYHSQSLFDLKRDFISTLSRSQKITEKEAKLRFGERIIKDFIQFLAPLM
jgi:cardiolipin synthase